MGGFIISSGEVCLVECVGGIGGMFLWVEIVRSVRGSLVWLVEVGPSV